MTKQSVERRMLRAGDIAADLGISRSRVYQLIAEGAIPTTRLNRSIYVPRPAWEAWLRRRSEEALADLAEPPSSLLDDARDR